ncbi:MAG: dephospho-CoA kinase [Rhodospirillaceae bacterium]
MIILGLTGSIGMGKTTAAENFRRLGVRVHDADAAVHRLMAPGGAAARRVAEAFPSALAGDAIDRRQLGALVFHNDTELERLETILHPLVGVSRDRFLAEAARAGECVVVLDVPLLFETGGETRCDAVCVVSAPAFTQRQRVLKRPGMTAEKLDAILVRQMPDAEKCRRADFLIPTGLGRVENFRAVATILSTVRHWQGRHWPPFPRRPRTRKKT